MVQIYLTAELRELADKSHRACNFCVGGVLLDIGHGRKPMNRYLFHRNGTVMDDWLVLLAGAAYAVAFYVFALTMKSVSLIA